MFLCRICYSSAQFFDIDPSTSPVSKWPDIIVELARSVPCDLIEQYCFRDVCLICIWIRVQYHVLERVVVFVSLFSVFLEYSWGFVSFLHLSPPPLLMTILSAAAKEVFVLLDLILICIVETHR